MQLIDAIFNRKKIVELIFFCSKNTLERFEVVKIV